jgi:hypothetical protein
MTRALAMLAALALVGCGAAPEPGREPLDVLTFSPAPELAQVVEAAVARIATATGRADITVGPGGLSVAGVPKMAGACAGTYMRDGIALKVEVALDRTGCRPIEVSVLHELVHILSGLGEDEHAESGVFSASHDTLLDESSLTTLCGAFECAAFIPEL